MPGTSVKEAERRLRARFFSSPEDARQNRANLVSNAIEDMSVQFRGSHHQHLSGDRRCRLFLVDMPLGTMFRLRRLPGSGGRLYHYLHQRLLGIDVALHRFPGQV
jgi:hypothetical protein